MTILLPQEIWQCQSGKQVVFYPGNVRTRRIREFFGGMSSSYCKTLPPPSHGKGLLQSRQAVVNLSFPLNGSGFEILLFMSQHRSLRGASATGAKRNVLKRFERVGLLKKRGQWKEGDRVMGLRKTKGEA
jgi:small basic protein (TIGR04137 family)